MMRIFVPSQGNLVVPFSFIHANNVCEDDFEMISVPNVAQS